MSLGGEGGGVKGREKGGSQRSEVYGCLVGWCYLPQYFCSNLDNNIRFLQHDSMLPPNNINSFLVVKISFELSSSILHSRDLPTY